MEFVILGFNNKLVRYFLDIAYNGKNYFGWQRQPNEKSVQEVLEDALSLLMGEPIPVTGAGRTDTGVHARQLMVHFDAEEISDTDHLKYRLNTLLPKDIAVKELFRVRQDAHARFDALSREYEYWISLKKDPFLEGLAYYTRNVPDIDKMNQAAEILFEYIDFQCFSRSKTEVKTYHCTIKKAGWKRKGDVLIFTISADRFLRNMVRAIVGTLLEIGYGKLDILDFHTIIKSKDRSNAGASAPAHGLYLTQIIYSSTIKL